MVAVIKNTLYRAETEYRGANSVCSVVYHPKQYSWVWDDVQDIVRDPEFEVYYMIEAFSRDYIEDFYSSRLKSYQIGNCKQGANHYHASYVSPYWADDSKKCGQIGAHIFYNL